MAALARVTGADASSYPRVVFMGESYRLIGETDGPIATDEQFENGECSFAHLLPDGRIMRYGEQIGTRDDLQFAPIIEKQAVDPRPSREGSGK